jgi:hypothetical protein
LIEQFDYEIDAVSVRKAKNIANEVDRKRTNKMTLRFASSIESLPPPGPAKGRAILIPEIHPLLPINADKNGDKWCK